MGYAAKLQLIVFLITTLAIITSKSDPNLDRFTSEEVQAIEKLRSTVIKFLTMDFHKTDAYILRWIRGSKFDLQDAAQDIEKYFNWRKENNIDSILNKDESIPKALPYSVEGFDKEGRPIVFHPFGKWNIRKFVVGGKQDVVLRQYQRMYEDGIRKAFKIASTTGKDVDQIYVITDLQGFTAREHSCIGCIPVTLSFATSFASHVIPFAKNITLVNTPRIFQPVLSLARSVVTKVPIRDYDSDKRIWQEALLKEVSRDQLPVSLR